MEKVELLYSDAPVGLGERCEMTGKRMSIVKSESRESFFRIEDGVVLKPPKTLLALYQRKGLDVARAGVRSPFSDSNGKQNGS